jgi:hypothetical protein
MVLGVAATVAVATAGAGGVVVLTLKAVQTAARKQVIYYKLVST